MFPGACAYAGVPASWGMHHLGGDAARRDDVVIGFVGGGSRNWAAKLMHALALTDEFGGRVRLYDLDDESARTNAELGRKIQRQDAAVGHWTYEIAESLAASYARATSAVASALSPSTTTTP